MNFVYIIAEEIYVADFSDSGAILKNYRKNGNCKRYFAVTVSEYAMDFK